MERIVEMSLSNGDALQTVGVLGLSYKPGTNIVEASQALDIAASFARRGLSVTVFDPMSTENARQVLHQTVSYAESAEACLRGRDLVVIATPWPQFAQLDLSRLVKPGAVVVDCWRIFETCRLDGIRYLPIGRNLCGSESLRQGPAMSRA